MAPYFHDDMNEKDYIRERESETRFQLQQIREGSNRLKASVNSASTSVAQFAGLVAGRSILEMAKSLDAILSNSNYELPSLELAIIELQMLYGLRISEVLSIQFNDIAYDGSILIHGKKGSSDRYVHPLKFVDYWRYFRNNRLTIPSYCNRYYFYRLYKKKGIYLTMRGNKKSSVTHFVRYLYIAKMLNENIDIDIIKKVVGHKSINSTISYVSKLQK
ncbi:MAG TPA: tyrosine-type recombinase/integrase [Bacteroidales bacterium]|nr:tyrosine-type recombinase/integrase [Bacteroidales bacterium]